MKNLNSEKDLISFLKNSELNHVALLILDIFMPFKRVMVALITVFSPLLLIVFKRDSIQAGVQLFEDGSKLEHLKKRLKKN